MSIISISGKIGSGKDIVGEIIQIITKSPHFTDKAVLDYIGREHIDPVFESKKWADTLKDYVCMAIGCTREQLEDREFKEKELGEEWDRVYQETLPYGVWASTYESANTIVKMTPRLLLQLTGTNAIRNNVHPNYWVNCLMSKYKPKKYSIGIDKVGHQTIVNNLPNWVITDTRFPNELKAVKDRGGISIRINRTYSKIPLYIPGEECNGISRQDFEDARPKHESETALDNAEFDYTIENNGSIIELVGKVREILIKENIVK